MESYIFIIITSSIVILSYLFNYFSEKTKIPSVLLLIISGILIKFGMDSMGMGNFDFFPILEVLGIIGLIMIVLEAALDLELHRNKLGLIGKSMLVASLSLIISVFGVAGILHFYLDDTFLTAMLYATPLCILSSAIIIPSVGNLPQKKKEFLIYDGTFSDVLGIMFFYFLINTMESGDVASAGVAFGFSFFITILVAFIASFVVIIVFQNLKAHVKLFVLIATLLLLYAIGKLLHLSPLLIILIFGLIISNHHLIFKFFNPSWLNKEKIGHLEKDLHLITLESAFLVRTFFFIIFGVTITLASLLDLKVLLISLAIIAVLYAVRFVILRIFMGKDIYPTLFIAPRGLITVLLFFAIPFELQAANFDSGILLYVIIITSFVMTWGLIKFSGEPQPEEKKSDENVEVISEDGESTLISISPDEEVKSLPESDDSVDQNIVTND